MSLNIGGQMPFKKEKLSPEAVDHFVEKHHDANDKLGFPYITQDGRKLFFSPVDVFMKKDIAHFEYLLGQTTPYRNKYTEYSLKNIAYLHTGPKKSTTPWTTDPKVLQQFTQLILSLTYGVLLKGEDGPYIRVRSFVEPVIHEE